MLRAGSGLWTYPLSAQPPFPQLGKWNHVTGCAPGHVLSQVCAQVLARAATPRLVGTPGLPGTGLVLAGAWPPGGCPPSVQEERGLCCQGQDKGGAPGDKVLSGAPTGCASARYSAWGAGLWGPLPQPPVRFHLRLKFHF